MPECRQAVCEAVNGAGLVYAIVPHDEWMANRRDRVEWVAGWWHDFVRESDGAFLEWTPDPPKGVTEKVFGGWVFGFRAGRYPPSCLRRSWR